MRVDGSFGRRFPFDLGDNPRLVRAANVVTHRYARRRKVDALLQQTDRIQALPILCLLALMGNDFGEDIHEFSRKRLNFSRALPETSASRARPIASSRPRAWFAQYNAIAAFAITASFCASVPFPSRMFRKMRADSSMVSPPRRSAGERCAKPRSAGSAICSPPLK